MKRLSNPTSAFSARRMSRSIGLLIARLCAILAFCAGIAQAGPYDTWAKYKTLTINTTNASGGANVSGTVSNFPVLLRLDDDFADDILDEALANGADVRITNSDGSTALSYQIERWSSTAAEIWVLVPTVTGNSTTDIRIYWKKSGQSDASSASTVFATSNSFAGVWHLSEASSNTVGNYKDATGVTDNTAAQGMTNVGAGQVTGVVGNATAFDGSASYLGFGGVPGSTSAQTISFWMKADGLAYMSVIDKLPNDASGVGWNFKARNDGAMWYRTGSETNSSDYTKSSAYAAGTWVHVTGSFSGGNQNLYINGTAAGSAMTGVTKSVNISTTFLRFGIPTSAATTEKFDGALDEVQFSSTARNSDWIKLTYETQKSSATCVSFGPTVATTYYWNRNSVLTSSTDFSKAYNWASNSNGTGRMPVTADDDDFTSDSYDAAWSFHDVDGFGDTQSPYRSLTDNANQLTLRAKGADVYNAVNQFVAAYRSDITGDFDVSVKILSQTNTDIWAKAGIMMADNIGTLTNGGFAMVAVTPGNGFTFQYDVSGTVGELETEVHTGSATYPCWLRLVKNGTSVSGFYRTATASGWTQIGTAQTPQSTATNSQIGLFVTAHDISDLSTVVFDDFQGGTAISATDLDLSFGGSGSGDDADATLSGNQSAASIDFTGYTGTFNFGSSTLTINTGNATFVSGMTVTAGTGTLAFTGNSGTQTFTPKSGATFPAVTKSGASGTVTVATSALTAGAVTLTSGTWNWGSGLTHSVASISTSAGSMDFGSSTVGVNSGNANMSNLSAVVAGTGSLSFTGTSGTQVLTPPSGVVLPGVTHTAASILQISTNPLNCVSFNQSAGTLDFNSQNIATTGDFAITSGTTSSFTNLAGRTITVSGNASLAGQSGNLLNLSASAWTITVAGSLTADYANLGGSDASGGSRGTATHSRNSGSNTNWLFSVPAALGNLTKSLRLNFNTTNSGGGANVAGNVTNFPLFLRFTSSNLTFSATSEAGADLIFVDKDGTTLYHEVVEWDKANKIGKAWVRVPQVDGNSTTDYITLYYGCDSCTTNSYARSDSAFSDYAAAYHLNGGENKAYDATKNAYHGTFQQNQAMITGLTTKLAPVFNGTGDNITTTCPSNVGTRTLSGWIYPRTSDDVNGMETVIDGDVSGQWGSGFGIDNGVIVVLLDNQWWNTGRAVTLNAWQNVAVRFNATKAVLFLNGSATDSVTYTQGSISSTTYTIGKSVSNTLYFDGYLNEITVADSYRSTDYLKLLYETQKAGSTFLTPYTTASFQSSKVFKLNTTPSGANVTGDVTNFPLLLRIAGVTALGANNTGTTVPTDIRFLDGDGVTWLDYQIERWDRTGGIDSGEVWVRVPTVEGNYAGHSITMYYKQASGVSVVDGQCASCVFQTSNNYVANWHFNTSGTGARPDASGNALSLTTNNYSGSEFKGGVIAGADSLNGSNQYLNAASGFADWSNGFTYTGWAWWSSTGSYARLFDFGNGSTADNIYSGRSGTSTNSVSEIYNNTTSGGQKITTGTIATGVWGHFAVTVSGTTIKMYKNGVLEGTATSSQSLRNITRTNNYLGRSNWGVDAYYQGKFDEVAIANAVRDSNWIKLSYQNQRRDATPLFNPSPADFQFTRKLTFNTTKTGANVGGDVADFPLLVRLTGLSAYGVNGSGTTAPTDIRFLDGDGKTWLNYQVERWDRTGGIDSAEIWVLVPKVDGNSDHDFITMYYKTSGVTIADGQCSNCVFSTSNSHTGVWHLNEETAGTGTASVYRDATGNAYHGTDMISSTGRTGVVGWGHQFDATDDYINLVAGNTLMPNTSTPVTLSAWFSSSSFIANGSRIFGMPKSDSTTALGLATVSSSGNRLDAFLNGSSNKGYTTLSTSTWYHSALSWDGTTFRLYVNGTQDSSYVSVMAAATAATARIGIRTTNNLLPFDGYLDEVRFSLAARTADWIKLEYETQRRSSNLFWNNRVGPNNNAVLTATASSSSNISLSWPSTVTDSTNADSVGIWVGYSAPPDSANIAGATLVARLAKTDTVYSYPATYPTTYYFALAVRNTSGKWSPFTAASTDTVTLAGITMPDTVYVDSARGNLSNNCTAAQNPATPKKSVRDALACGASASDTLVVRVMPGTYYDSAFSITSKPSVVTSFDINSRAVFNGAGSGTLDGSSRLWTLLLYGNMGIRNLDVKCLINGYAGVYVTAADNVFVEGCRIYGSAVHKHNIGIFAVGGNNQHHFANNLIHEPIYYGMYTTDDNSFNVVNNTFVGPGGTAIGFSMATNAYASDMTLSNNIFYNWDYGLSTYTPNIGSCASNLFFGVTSGREVTTATCTGSIVRDPLFASTNPTDRNAFKLLPGSPAIDAGSSTYGSGGQAATRRTALDHFGSARTLGTAPDIGFYEGSGYTPNPSGEFDTLQVSSTATTATVQNSKWKLVWDKARGAGITGFYDKISDPGAASNLVHTNSLLFDAKIGSYTASSQTGVGPVLYLVESTRARAVVRQSLPVSASIDLNIYYTVYPSGHVYIESDLSNLSAGSTAVSTVDYTLRMGSTTAAFTSADSTRGFGYLTTATRDAMISVTRNLDGGASGAERWATSTAASGTPGTVVFNTTDLADLSQNTARRHDFLLYLGETALDFNKAAPINADAYGPSALTMSAGSLVAERSWQDALQGHWNLDDGAGTTARDKSVFVQSNATLAGANYKWVSGKVNGGLYLTTTDSAYVATATNLNPGNGFSVMFWLKPDFSGMGDTALIVSKGLTNATGWYCRKVANASGTNKILFNMGGTTVTSTSLTDLAWSHIAVVAVAGGNRNLEMYVNGVQVAASTSAATAVSNSLNLLMGYASGSVGAAKFKGTLDDVRVYGLAMAGSEIQSIYNRGFSSRYGHYALRADNNNRLVALINGDTAKTRMQPAFYISNWYGPRTPKYVYLNGTRLTPNVDFVSDSINGSAFGSLNGNFLAMQLNKVLTGANQTLFIDDDDSTGFMGAASAMKTLTISSVASDKITVKNFSDTVFGGSASGQWYMELDLNGWATPTRTTLTDTGFGEINVWKAAAVSPNVAISSAYQMVGWGYKTGRSLSYMKMDTTGSNEVFTAGSGFTSAGITYALTDSSSTRLSLTLSGMNLSQGGTVASVTKRFTFYPTGRVFVSYAVTGATIDLDAPRVDLNPRYDGANPSQVWTNAMARDSARQAFIGGSANYHSIGLALLSIKNNASNYVTGATMLGSSYTVSQFGASNDQRLAQFNMPTSIWTGANKPVTVNFMMDFSKDFTDSATADSLLRDAQRPAVLTAITGTRVTNDALDFNTDNFAEGDGTYTYAASSGVAHFRFVNAVASFNPAFRISTWTQGVLPEFVVVDNQVLVRGYHYNAYLSTASNEVILQLNKTLAPGTHVIFISHKSGLAVTLRAFTATGGDGADTLDWTTESEFENLGYHVWRRLAPGEAQSDSSLADGGQAAEDGAADTSSADTLPSHRLTAQELAALGYVRINAGLIPGAKGGSSASTLDYRYVDRTAAFGFAYEYLLEAVDFNGSKVQYGPRTARPTNPLTTELGSNYPNPFNPITTLRFTLKEKLKVSLVIYDSKGRLVRTLVRPDRPMAAGKYRLVWDARNEGGMEAPSGQYFYRFTAGRYVKTRKMILVK
jgi:hypothetical protein